MNLNKTELIEALAAKADISKTAAGNALDALLEVVTETLVAGGGISLVGFGSLTVGERAARTGRNPQTGAPLKIAASRVAKFSAGAKLKAALNAAKGKGRKK
ncbi:MAG: HU family DNA-binding protein [Zoogloeaceae bacterium]|jgi:DNA-binding protein HU-beta|nr:HU family DNA-binding protein [Zoogloeaceae bacterium]